MSSSHDPDRDTTVRPPLLDGTSVDLEPVYGVIDDHLALSTSAPVGAVVRVRARGEIDMISAADLRQTLGAAARTARGRPDPGAEVVCDLSDVHFFGAAGVRALLDAVASARDHGVALTVVPSRCVRRLVTLTGTEGEIPLAEPASGPGQGRQ